MLWRLGADAENKLPKLPQISWITSKITSKQKLDLLRHTQFASVWFCLKFLCFRRADVHLQWSVKSAFLSRRLS